MKMTPERLQDIKNLVHSWAYPLLADDNDRLIEVSLFQELIFALEATNDNATTWQNTAEELGRQLKVAQTELSEARAELAEANECCDRLTNYFEVSEDWKERCHDRKNLINIEKDRCDLRKQLAEEKKWTIKYREAIIEDKAMTKQLAEAQTDVERLQSIVDKFIVVI